MNQRFAEGEHWHRATVLNHGDKLGKTAEGNSHRGHPGSMLATTEITIFSSSSSKTLCPVQVYVVSAQKQLMEERMKLVDELWAADIRYFQS